MKANELLHLIKALETEGFNTTFTFNRVDQELTLTIVKKRMVEAVMQ